MAIKSALWGLGGAVALASLMSVPAFAGHGAGHGFAQGCAIGVDCQPSVEFLPSARGHTGGMTIQNTVPYDHLDSVHFQRDPHVNITRVHGMMPSATIKDAPVAFSGTCHPESTVYCRHDGGTPVNVTMNAPLATPGPFIAPPPAPIMQAPVFQPPAERLVAVGGGYDPSKFAPRTYGDPHTITLGIAHIPTSIVDRDPARAQAVLDSGRAVSRPFTPGGTTPALTGAPMRHLQGPAPQMMRAPMMAAPRPMVQSPWTQAPRVQPPMVQAPIFQGPVMGSIPTGHPGAAGAPMLQPNGTYGSTVGADGSYWEKMSGPTVVGGLPATQVICKRQLQTHVMRPLLAGSPHPVMAEAPCNLPPGLAQYEGAPRGRY